MDTTHTNIVTRFAPSPTGLFHVGSARTALFNWIYSKVTGGEFIIRIEDTDKERSKREYEENIQEGLSWLGLDETLPLYRQSERGELYSSYVKKLLESGSAYVSEESEGERSQVIRFKNPNKVVVFEDVIRGSIEVDTTDLGDFVIAKSEDEPLYHLAVVIDDAESGVTHVIRGEDHISNTPRQILIQEALGFTRPIYAHLPLILGTDKSKLSKRHGATALVDYKKMGILPEAMFNYLALLGWNPGDDREVLTRDEIIELFTLENIQKGGAVFNLDKLLWVNRQHILRLSEHDFMHLVKEWLPADITSLPNFSEAMLTRVLPIIRERSHTLRDIREMAEEGSLEYYFEKPGYFAEKLMWKDDTDPVRTAEHIAHVRDVIIALPEEQFTPDTIRGSVWEYATEVGRGSVLWPMRYALSGMDRSPDPFELAATLGKEETIERLETAHQKLIQIAK